MINVLLVDDEPEFLDQGKIFLESADERLNVSTALSAEEGIELLDRQNFDAIVSDYQMPDMNGIEFLKEVRENRNNLDIPFIVLTGRGREEVAMKALNLGADRYLQKSVDMKTQFEILANIVKKEVKKITEKMYRNLLEYSPNPVTVLSDDMKIEAVNEKLLEMIDQKRDKVEGSHISSIVLEEEENKLERVHAYKNIEQDEVATSYHTVIRGGSGEEINVLVSISLLPESEKSIVVFFDLAEWSQNEQLITQIKDFDIEDPEEILDTLSKRFEEVINEEKIKSDIRSDCLEELTILMIANEGKIHGKGIIDELRERFGISVSAGTMYPILHDLEEKGILEKHEGIQSKKYSLKERSEAIAIAREKIKSLFSQYLLLYHLYSAYMDRD